MMQLGDDGTMDTVIVCSDCGEEFRFNYATDDDASADSLTDEERYDAFVASALTEAAEDHECAKWPARTDDDDPADRVVSFDA